MIVAGAILGLASTAALSSFLYVQRSDRLQSVQSELDIDSRQAVERLRRDLWRTSRDHILLYPSGPGPYSAISFPLLNNLDPDEPVPLDEDGKIIWDATVIYHFWEGDAPELRVTTLSPRGTLSDEDRLTQLEDVVIDGGGGHTFNSQNANTRTVIRNLVDWQLNIIRARFDGYAPNPGRRNSVPLGSALLHAGPNLFTFRVADRNPSSSGHTFGIDALTVSPTVSRREAEAQLPLHGHSGGTPQIVYIPGGTWSGNYRLDFSAGGTDAELTFSLPHDRWEERNFMDTGVRLEDAEITFDTDLHPHAYVVRLPGNDKVWEAVDQTGDDVGVGQESSAMFERAVRIVLKGSEILGGGFLNFNGQNAWIGFRAAGPDTETGTQRRLFIQDAFIAESDDPPNVMDFRPGTEVKRIQFGGSNSRLIADRWESDMVDMAIERDKNYVIAFLVKHTEPHGYAWVWTPPGGAPPSSYMILPENAPTSADLLDSTWSTRPDVTESSSIFAIEYVHAGHPAEGRYATPVFDTHNADPDFHTLTWNAETPDTSDVEIRIRSGVEPDLSDAPEWDSLAPRLSGQSVNLSGQYVQVKATLIPGTDSLHTPRLKDFTLGWAGETRIVDISGAFSTGPDHGILELEVNGAPLFQGVTVNLTVYKDVELGRGTQRRMTSAVVSEMIPRNTGK